MVIDSMFFSPSEYRIGRRITGMIHHIHGCLFPIKCDIMVEYSVLTRDYVISVMFKDHIGRKHVDLEGWVMKKTFFNNTVQLCEIIKTEIYKINERIMVGGD